MKARHQRLGMLFLVVMSLAMLLAGLANNTVLSAINVGLAIACLIGAFTNFIRMGDFNE